MDTDINERLREFHDVLERSKGQPGHGARVRYAMSSLDHVMSVVSGGVTLPVSSAGSTVQAASYQISLTGTCPHCSNSVTLTAP